MQEQDNQHLDNIIKSSFEKRGKGAPDKLWGNLNSALDNEATSPVEKNLAFDPLDRKVKESFSSLNERAPRHVWPSINRQLNIDKVWQGISHELGKNRPLYRPASRMAAAILLLLLSGAGAYFIRTNTTTEQQLVYSPERVSPESTEPFFMEESTAGLEITEKASTVKPESFREPSASNQGTVLSRNASSAENLQSGKESKQKPAGHKVKEEPATATTAPGSLASSVVIKEGKEETDPIYSQSYPEVVSGIGKAPETKALAVGEIVHSNAKIANASAETGNPANASLQEQISLNTLAGSKLEQPRVEEGSLPAAPENSNHVPVSANREARAAFTSPEPLMAGSEGRQAALFVLPHAAESLPFNMELKNGIVDVPVVPVDTTAHQEILASYGEEKTPKQAGRPKFEAGPVMVYHNSWLLNNETKNSYDKNSLIATDPTYKQNWGLVFNYHLSKKSLIASELHIISKAGQQYKMYQEGEYLKKSLELRYYKLYLQYQQNFLSYGKKLPNWLTLKAGAYGGYLYEKRGEIRQEESRYDNFDYGLKLALGQETKAGRLILGYGISAERGLNNIFRGTESLPGEFNKTYVLNFGTYFNMRYCF